MKTNTGFISVQSMTIILFPTCLPGFFCFVYRMILILRCEIGWLYK